MTSCIWAAYATCIKNESVLVRSTYIEEYQYIYVRLLEEVHAY